MQVFGEKKSKTESDVNKKSRKKIQFQRDLEFIRGMHHIKSTVCYKGKRLNIEDVNLLSRADARKLSMQLRKQLAALGFLAFVLS